MSDGKSFLERREQAEIAAAQIKEIAPDAKTISFIERDKKSTTIITARRAAKPWKTSGATSPKASKRLLRSGSAKP